MSSYRTVFLTALVVVATITGVTLATAPAAAQSDGMPLEGILDSDDSDTNSPIETISSLGSSAWAAGGGFQDRAAFWLAERLPDSAAAWVPVSNQTAADEAREVARYYNVNNATLEGYANDRGNWSSNKTVSLTISIDGETAQRYLLVNVSNGSIESSRIVNSTSRTSDHYVELCGFGATQAREELGHFTEEYAEPNKTPDQAYKARMAAKYGGSVETDLYPSSGSCGANSTEAT